MCVCVCVCLCVCVCVVLFYNTTSVRSENKEPTMLVGSNQLCGDQNAKMLNARMFEGQDLILGLV